MNSEDVCLDIKAWKALIPEFLLSGKTVCFDNLALEQLNLHDVLPKEVYATRWA